MGGWRVEEEVYIDEKKRGIARAGELVRLVTRELKRAPMIEILR